MGQITATKFELCRDAELKWINNKIQEIKRINNAKLENKINTT